jgi:S1-C subfamily serine protease
MLQSLVGLLIGFLIALPFHQGPVDWFNISRTVNQSVVRLTFPSLNPQADPGDLGSCTGFSIHRAKHFYLSALHCLGEPLEINGQPISKIVYQDASQDLMVIEVLSLPEHPALHPANKIKMTAEACIVGYAFGEEHPVVRISHISNPAMIFSVNHLGGPWIVMDAGIEPGMSGSAIVDAHGRVIAIAQNSGTASGFGANIQAVYDSTKDYWEFSP